VLVKMIAAPLTESELRWFDGPPPCGGSDKGPQLPACAGNDGVGIVVATAKCAPPPSCTLFGTTRSREGRREAQLRCPWMMIPFGL